MSSPQTKNSEPIINKKIKSPSKGDMLSKHLNDILAQRSKHRQIVMCYSMLYCGASLLVIFLILAAQSIKRWNEPQLNFKILDDGELNLLIISVFGQLIGVIYIITKSLWDGSDQNGILNSIYK